MGHRRKGTVWGTQDNERQDGKMVVEGPLTLEAAASVVLASRQHSWMKTYCVLEIFCYDALSLCDESELKLPRSKKMYF